MDHTCFLLIMTRLDREKVAKLAKLFKEEAAELARNKGQHTLAKQILRKKLDWEAIKEIVLAEPEPKPKYGDTPEFIEIKEYSDIVR